MGTLSLIDMFLFLKKRVKVIIALTLLGALGGGLLAGMMQSYTATVGIHYNYSGAAEQLNPLGGPLDVYEMMQPALVNKALKEMESDLSVEEVRNKLSIEPVVKTSDTEVKEAKIKLGETAEVTTADYNVTYTCSGKLGGDFAQRFLHQLLQAYDAHFSQQYLAMNRVPDFMSIVDLGGMDYMEICSYIDAQLNHIIGKLDALVGENSSFTSYSTGLDFAAIRAFYTTLRDNQYRRLYANVRSDLLTKNKDLLLKGYKKRIEDMLLLQANNEDESAQAYELVQTFYDQYKKNNLYYQARTTQLETDNDNDNKNLVYDYDLSLMINTYDSILLRYVDTGVEATTLGHDRAYYENRIQAFETDQTSAAERAIRQRRADGILDEIAKVSTRYAALANQTLADYYEAKIADNVKYMMAIEVVPGVSPALFMAIGMFLMLLVGAAFVIVAETIRASVNRQRLEQIQFNEDGTLTAEVIEAMSPLERAFYEQAMGGFDEFYLMYQPMVRNGKWKIAETLVRWGSRHFGQIMPDDFIRIAEKYKLMDRLGTWILEEACKQSKRWKDEGQVSPAISINYSAQQIESQSFLDSICDVIASSDVDASKIYLEISGGGELQNIEALANKFVALKALNVRLTIDRFGDSITSLRVLYDLPADMLKLDRRMLDALGKEGSREMAFLQQVIAVGQERGLKICACGVEEPWQEAALTNLGVTYLQGFYYASPLLAKDYEQRYAGISRAAHPSPTAATEEV